MVTADPLFVSYLVVAVLALLACLAHAWPDRTRMVLLATTTVYGIILEQLVILRFDRYVYNVDDWLLVLGDVPIVIGFGWAAIIYSGLVAGRELGLTGSARALFVGLYALHIDLAIDAVAIRIPFWQWTPPGVWLGVPLGNFLGWFLVATLFSAAWLGLAGHLERPCIRGPIGMGLALGGLVVGLEAWEAVATTLLREVVVLGLLLGAALLVVGRGRPEGRIHTSSIAAVPLLYHGTYLAYLFGLGLYRETPLLLVPSLLLTAVTLRLHAPALDDWRSSS
ncbi:MAG: carotenoid biosynthesis protein [Halobacteriaceae archaeon]